MIAPELHWLAGLLDGEGSFDAHGSQRVAATQKRKELMVRVRRVIGRGKIRKFKTEGVWYWRYEVTGETARRVMNALYPLMSRYRRRQIERALKKNGLGRQELPAQVDFKAIA